MTPRPALTMFWLGALAALAPWWWDTSSLATVGSALTAAGRVTGLLAGYLVAVLLILMARTPALERGVGADRLARWHSSAGRATIGLVLAHAALITVGYAATTDTGVMAQAWDLLTSYEDVLWAGVATLIFVAVGVSSAMAARKHLSYRAWYSIHLLTYLAVYLGFGHQIATGEQFLAHPTAATVWTAFYLLAAGLLAYYRVLIPLRDARRHTLKVIEVRRENDHTVSVILSGRNLHWLNAQSGQFFRLRFLARGMWGSANPYSLSAPPHPGLLRVTIKNLGDHSGRTKAIRPGTRVIAEGPYGVLTADQRTRRNVLLIGAGVGITPLRALFESLPGLPGTITMIYRASDADELVLRHEIDAIAAARGSKVFYVVGTRQQLGGDPLTASAMSARIPDLAEHDIYLCGPSALQNALERELQQAGVPKRQIHLEDFALQPRVVPNAGRRVLLATGAFAAATAAVLGARSFTADEQSLVAAATDGSSVTGTTDSTPSTPGSTGAASAPQVIEGASVDTRWGPVQVAVTVDGTTITKVEAIDYPTENRKDIEINEYALPILADAVLAAQSANIDYVSGATVTSVGYVQSLQSALDQIG